MQCMINKIFPFTVINLIYQCNSTGFVTIKEYIISKLEII